MFKVNNRKTNHRSGVFIVNFEHISHLVLVFLLVTLNMQLPVGKKIKFRKDFFESIESHKYILVILLIFELRIPKLVSKKFFPEFLLLK